MYQPSLFKDSSVLSKPYTLYESRDYRPRRKNETQLAKCSKFWQPARLAGPTSIKIKTRESLGQGREKLICKESIELYKNSDRTRGNINTKNCLYYEPFLEYQNPKIKVQFQTYPALLNTKAKRGFQNPTHCHRWGYKHF